MEGGHELAGLALWPVPPAVGSPVGQRQWGYGEGSGARQRASATPYCLPAFRHPATVRTAMTRRTFTGATIAAGGLCAQPRRPKIGFIGLSHSHGMEKLAAASQFFVTVAWDDRPAFRQHAPQVTPEGILNDPEIQAVAIEGDVAVNFGWAQKAIAAGKHVHLEKPPAATWVEFRDLVREAERRRLVLQLGYMWRYNPAIVRLFEMARGGVFGDIYLVRGTMNTLASAEQRQAWGRFQGGDLFEQGSHLIDLAVWLMGKPVKVSSILRTDGGTDGFADNTLATLEWPKAMGIVTAATLQPNARAHRFFEVCGSRGTGRVAPLEPPVLHLDLSTPPGSGVKKAEPLEFEFRRYVGDFAELHDCISRNRPLSITPQHDLDATETLFRACEML